MLKGFILPLHMNSFFNPLRDISLQNSMTLLLFSMNESSCIQMEFNSLK